MILALALSFTLWADLPPPPVQLPPIPEARLPMWRRFKVEKYR